MRSRQWERSPAVIEVRGRPRGSAVTDFAGLRKACRDVIRICCVIEVRKMA